MQLEIYISDLLYRYECVTVPEFGSFLTQCISAKIIEEHNSFYPPKKALLFNEQIQQNDGLLTKYIADIEKIPFEAASKKISSRVKVLKSYLIQGEILTFKNIGEISMSTEGKLLFEPSYELNYLTDAFGLAEFSSPMVSREVYKKQAEAIEKVIPIGVTPKKRESKSFLKYASVALIALTLGGLVASNYYVNSIETHNQIAQEEAQQQLEDKIQKATFVIDNPLTTITLSVPKQSGNYHIVAGAFRVEENSVKKINQLKAQGFKARKLGVNKYGLHEVVYSSYEDAQEALKALRNIRKTHNKDAWLKIESNKSPSLDKNTSINTSESVSSSKIGFDMAKKNKSSLVDELISSNEFVLNQSPNIIEIINNVTSVDSGFYSIIAAYTAVEKRDAFLKLLASKGVSNANYFFNASTGNYYIYTGKFNDLKVAENHLDSNHNLIESLKMAIIKVEN